MRVVVKTLPLIVLVSFITPSTCAQEELWKELNSKAIKFRRHGRYSEGVKVAEEALKVAKKTFSLEHRNVATCLNSLAELYRAQGKYTEAEPLYKRSLAIWEKALGPDHPDVALSLNNLAELYRAQGKYAEAEPLYKRSLTIYEKALGPDHPSVAASLNNLSLLYKTQGKYAEAEPLYKRSLSIREKALGSDHPDVANSLHNLAELYREQGKYAEAEPLYKRSLAILKKALGPDHPYVATSLNNLALLYDLQGEYAEVEPLYKRSLSIREKALGPDHPDVAASLSGIAALYYSQGKYAEVEPLFKRALSIWEKALGPDHPDVATSLNNLALLYNAQGKYAEAEPLYKRSLAIREKALGPDHPAVANSLHNLALLYRTQGKYAEAEPLYWRSLEILEKTLGKTHPNVAQSLHNLAELYLDQGKYAEAEPLCRRSLAISEKISGKNHFNVATSLYSLARLYFFQGKYTEAESLYKRSLEIVEKAFGEDHPYVALSLNGLAIIYKYSGKYVQAEPLFQRSLEILEKTFGEYHRNIAAALNNLAAVYDDQRKYAEAEQLYKRSLAILEKALGKDHPLIATSLNNIAGIYRVQGKYAKAEPLYERSLSIFEKALGKYHPYVALSLDNLAILKIALGNNKDGLNLMVKAREIQDKQTKDIFSFALEKERLLFLNTIKGSKNCFLSLCVEQLTGEEEGRKNGIDYLIRRKGMVLDSLIEDARVARLSGDPEVGGLIQRLKQTKGRLARMVLAGPGEEGAEKYRTKVSELEKESEDLEKELNRKSVLFKSSRETERIGLEEVANALSKREALVEFAKYQSFDFKKKSKELWWGDYKYIAYILKGSEEVPELVKLGKAKEIEGLILGYRKAVDNFAKREGDAKELRKASLNLEKVVWEPIKKTLGDIKKVYLSPDGELNFVSFGGLMDEEGRYVVEDYDLAYVSSGKDLVRKAFKGEKERKVAMLVGAPDFGGKASSQEELLITRGAGYKSRLGNLRAFGGMRFEPLPGTREEIKEIIELAEDGDLKAESYIGNKATEGRVKSAEEPKILHLATHGFFLPESGWKEEKKDDCMEMGSLGEKPFDLAKFKLENPMHRSGLALSGANLTLEGKISKEGEDGILTAEEVAGLDLLGTDLVVLSACETGLGEAVVGEGVLGLRRAFVQAGVKSLVMTLWSVQDEPTREIMVSFYKRYLKGDNAWDALLGAQREYIAKERKAGRESNPYHWAAFVASGIGVD